MRAQDNAGNWGSPDHYKITIDIPAPYFEPTLSGPAGQLDPDNNPVVKNGDLLALGGSITEGPGGALDPLATISACDLVVENEAGTEVNRIAVALTSCTNSGGNLTGSVSPADLGAARGTVHLAVVAERTQDGVTKSSGIRSSNVVMVDNDTPVLAAVVMGCGDDSIFCDDSRSIVVELSEAVKGEFLAADFAVSSNQLLAAGSACSTPDDFCDEVTLTLGTALDTANPPSVIYDFVALSGRTQPHDGAGHLLGAGTVGATAADPDVEVDEDATFYLDDLADPALELQSSPDDQVLVVDANVLQGRNGDFGSGVACSNEHQESLDYEEGNAARRACEESPREIRFARKLRELARKSLGVDDGMSYAPDIVLLQEIVADAKDIAGHLNRLINLDGATCNNADAADRCYRVAIRPKKWRVKDKRKTSANYSIVADTAILYNRRTVAFTGDKDTFDTWYSQDEMGEDTDENGLSLYLDADFDGDNDLGTRKIKRHSMARFVDRSTGASLAVASVHLQTKSHFANPDVNHDIIKTRWANKMIAKLEGFASSADLYQIGGDFNIRRCISDEKPEPIVCGEHQWWRTFTIDNLWDDAVYASNPTQEAMKQQYQNGSEGERPEDPTPNYAKRIDFVFGFAGALSQPTDASKDFTCGKGEAQRPLERQTCLHLDNKERYTDHQGLIWALWSLVTDPPI